MDRHKANKTRIAPIRAAMYDFDKNTLCRALTNLSEEAVHYQLCHPFGDFNDPESFCDKAYGPLLEALPDLERRDYIVMAGEDEQGYDWVGCAGYYTGVFVRPWLDIPPTGHQVHMRFHEFYRMENGKLVNFQGLWDIPELMLQSGAWPMAPGLGREWHVPAPATMDGLRTTPYDEKESLSTRQHIMDMLDALQRHPGQGGPEVMEMDKFWHPRMNWYGPSGIGTGRGIPGFRNWHQIPFLKAMPDRGLQQEKVVSHFFADGNYAAVTGWPNMMQTITGDGWMGIAPSNQPVTLRSLDFWRVEEGLIRENWVLIDLLDLYRQVGVDVFARLGEFNKARNVCLIESPGGQLEA